MNDLCFELVLNVGIENILNESDVKIVKKREFSVEIQFGTCIQTRELPVSNIRRCSCLLDPTSTFTTYPPLVAQELIIAC